MSLQVWLPLTKDLRQQGLSNATVTNNGATYSSTGGKLGGCYIFDGIDDYLSLTINNIISSNNAFSICSWVNLTSGNSYYPMFFFGTATPNGSGVSGVSLHGSLCNRLEGSDGIHVIDKTFSTNVTVGSWHHVTITYDGASLKYYCNGVLKDLISWSYGFGNQSSIKIGDFWGPNFKGQINDFRIYDHCLSPMEVKQISQGLVLHYPLNRNGWGQENLLVKSGVFSSTSGWTNNQNVTLSTSNNELKAVINQTDSTPGIKATNTFNLTAGTYTASLLIKVENGNKNFVNYPFYINNGTALYNGAYTKKENRGDYVYEEATFTLTSNANNIVCYILTSGSANGETWYLKWIKLEKGSKATPWCPNSSDTLATTMGLNGTVEYDCSGFCNNGTRVGDLTWTSDTPKYNVSTQFANNKRIVVENANTTEVKTIAFWAKTPTAASSNQIAFVDYKSLLAFGFFSNYILVSYGNTCNKVYATTPFTANEWHHVVLVRQNSSTIDCYIDNEIQTVSSGKTDYWSITANVFHIGSRNNSYPWPGLISDFRCYATALSADDVRSLYQNSAYIDSSGNIYGTIHET